MLTGCKTKQDRINMQYHTKYDQTIKEFKDKNLKRKQMIQDI